MKKIIFCLATIVLMSGCTVFRSGMLNEARMKSQAAGYVQSPMGRNVMLSPRAASVMAQSDPLMALQLGVDPDVAQRDMQVQALASFNQEYGISPSRATLNLGTLCWSDHPVKWPMAVAADKSGPILGGAAILGSLGWAASEINTGGGDNKQGSTERTGDGNVIYNNDGDGNVDSHDYEGMDGG